MKKGIFMYDEKDLMLRCDIRRKPRRVLLYIKRF
jgi:hypothetical protein